jgi:DNA-binding CsgD family transcriptional regulator
MFSGEAGLLAVVDRFQSAALGEATWLEALEGVAGATGSRTGQIIGLGSEPAVPFNWMTEMPEEASQDFLELGGGDPQVNRRVDIGGTIPELRVLADGDFAAYGRPDDPAELKAWIDRYDAPHICLTPLVKQDDLLVGLAVLRSRKDGHINEEQRRVFTYLAPHLRAAVRTQMALMSQGVSVIAGTMETLSIAAFVCDPEGRVLSRTSLTESLLRGGSHFRLRGGRLTACNDPDGKALATEIFTAGLKVGASRPAGPIVLRDAFGGDPLLIEVASLPASHHPFGVERAVLVMVGSRRMADNGAMALSRALYGLTAAEAEIVGDLMAGLRPQTIAIRRGTALTTVRTHIRRILDKAEVSSQLELVGGINARL